MNNENIKLNNYEKFFFNKFFGTNLKRLRAFRKAVSKEQREGIYRGEPYTYKWFNVKGGKLLNIQLSRKKIDKYIELIEQINKK